jgi:hypothetical protein
MFATVEREEHAQWKRSVQSVFSKSSIFFSETRRETTRSIVGKVLSILEERATNGNSIDIRELSEAYAMDSLTQLQFGSTAGSHFLDDLRNWTSYSTLFHLSRRQYHFVENEVPGLLSFLNRISISRPRRQIVEATSTLEDWNLQMCIQAENLLCRQEKIAPADYPAIYALE